jgi:hypothetical protein
MGTAVKSIDIVVLVDPDRGNIGVERQSVRQFCPVVDDLITKAVHSE